MRTDKGLGGHAWEQQVPLWSGNPGPRVLKGQGEEAGVGAHVPRLDPKDSRGSAGFHKGRIVFLKTHAGGV